MNQDPSQLTSLIIDEKRQLPKTCGHALNRAAYRGRSSGICPLVAFQDWNSLLELYGQAGANELAANFQTKLFLKQGSEEAAQWAAHCLGKPEAVWETTNRSYTSSQVDSRTHGFSTHIGDRFLFHPSQLRSLPLANRLKNSIQGYMTTPALKGSIAFDAKFLEIAKRCQPSSDFPNYVRRPQEDQVLQPFSPIDADLWSLPPSKELHAAFAAIPTLPSLSIGNPRSLTQGVAP